MIATIWFNTKHTTNPANTLEECAPAPNLIVPIWCNAEHALNTSNPNGAAPPRVPNNKYIAIPQRKLYVTARQSDFEKNAMP